jgi:hypothetical protein
LFPFNLDNIYGPIYSGTMSDAQVSAVVEGLVQNVVTALDFVLEAGAKVVLGNVFDYAAMPLTRQQFPDPGKRQRVTMAVKEANSSIRVLAEQRELPYWTYLLGVICLYCR